MMVRRNDSYLLLCSWEKIIFWNSFYLVRKIMRCFSLIFYHEVLIESDVDNYSLYNLSSIVLEYCIFWLNASLSMYSKASINSKTANSSIQYSANLIKPTFQQNFFLLKNNWSFEIEKKPLKYNFNYEIEK